MLREADAGAGRQAEGVLGVQEVEVGGLVEGLAAGGAVGCGG